jgi:hypothetical protein
MNQVSTSLIWVTKFVTQICFFETNERPSIHIEHCLDTCFCLFKKISISDAWCAEMWGVAGTWI